MADPILEEIWRVRQMLIKQHGGVEGYFQHIQKLDTARRRAARHKNKVRKRREKAAQ